MQDPIEIIGYWWLPDAADERLPGTLSFSQDDGAYLHIVGFFGTEQIARFDRPEIILGYTQQGKPITLYGCIKTQGTYPIMNLGDAKYKVKFVFEGVHFENEADIKFHQLYGSYTDLDAWVNIYGFTIEQERDDGRSSWKVRYEKPLPQFFDIGGDLEVGISFASFGPKLSIVQTEVHISQRAFLSVKSKQDDISFNDLFAKLNTFTYLLQISAQRIPYPISIFGLSQANARALDNGEQYFPKISIYYQPIEAIKSQTAKIPQEMLFTYSDMNETQITVWFHSFEKYRTVIHLYRSLFYSDRLFADTKFLNIAQALESLHSILFNNQCLPHDEFTSRKDQVLEEVSEDLREWVENALNDANYKPFREKILELLTNKQEIITVFVDDFDLFAKRVMHTRNEFVHHNKRKWSFQNGVELFTAINTLTILFEAYILEIIGFSNDKVRELLNAKIQTHLTGWKTLRSTSGKSQ
ncbi:MAG: HEPN domain-containing protein [Chloroflexota bacterium]